jgi:hypothetical protein
MSCIQATIYCMQIAKSALLTVWCTRYVLHSNVPMLLKYMLSYYLYSVT